MSAAPGPMIDRVHGRFRYAWLFSAVWLVYLGYPLSAAWAQPDPLVRALGVAAIALFATTFVLPFSYYQRRRRAQREIPLRMRWSVLAAMALLLVAAAPAAGDAVVAGSVYLAVTAVLTLPFVQAWSLVLATLVAVEVIPRFVPGWTPDAFLGLQVVVSSVAAWGITQVIARGADLAYAREQLAELAVVAERDRVARDMHDILGHSLTVIAVKAELAGRLISVDTDRARQEIADVERLARQSLADVRETVGGLRRVSLAKELAGARTALEAAGIAVVLPSTIDDVPPERDELHGWVVREGTTNVIRHSGATRCEIRLGPDGVEVLDDGRGLDDQTGADDAGLGRRAPVPTDTGQGLTGLRERVDAVGGVLTAGPGTTGGFCLAVRAPVGRGPARTPGPVDTLVSRAFFGSAPSPGPSSSAAALAAGATTAPGPRLLRRGGRA